MKNEKKSKIPLEYSEICRIFALATVVCENRALL